MEALVDSIMSKAPEPVDANMTVKDAAAVLAHRTEKCLVVANGDFVIGVVTATDMIEKVLAAGANPAEVYVRDIMSTPVVSVKAGAPLREAAEIMSDYGITKLPVLDESGGLVGMVTYLELSRWLAKQSNYEDPALNALAKMKKEGGAGPYR